MHLNGNTIIYIKTHEEKIIRAAPPPRRGDVTRRQRRRSRFARRRHNNVLYRLTTAVGVHCTTIGGVTVSMLQHRRKQTPKTWTFAPTKLQSPVDHNQTTENVSEHRRARYLNWQLPKRILHIHFAQHDACPSTESFPQIQDTPHNIALYVTELTCRSRRKIGVFVNACH